MREGRLSLDQVGVIAEKAGEGSDEHYVTLAEVATVNQLRTALKAGTTPRTRTRTRARQPERSITKTSDEQGSYLEDQTCPMWMRRRSTRPWPSHQDALITEWKRDHEDDGTAHRINAPPLPNTGDAFMSLVEAGWDAEVARRPHGHRTTVVVHLDVKEQRRAVASGSAAHRGRAPIPVLRRHLRGVVPPRRTGHRRRAHHPHHQPPATPCPGVPPPHLRGPGCGATRGLHAHHIQHWEDGGATELAQPGAAVPLPSPAASPRRHHHHRTTREPDRHRQ